MAKEEEKLLLEGKVEEVLPNLEFLVSLLSNGKQITAKLSGKMRMKNIRVWAGDRVLLEISPYDLTKGRIIFRQK